MVSKPRLYKPPVYGPYVVVAVLLMIITMPLYIFLSDPVIKEVEKEVVKEVRVEVPVPGPEVRIERIIRVPVRGPVEYVTREVEVPPRPVTPPWELPMGYDEVELTRVFGAPPTPVRHTVR